MVQLDLFVDFLAPADVMSFPLAGRISLARKIAADLDALSFQDGKAHWRAISSELRKELRSSGISSRAVKQELSELAEAVHRELRTLHLPEKRKSSAAIISLEGKRVAQRKGARGGEADALRGQGGHPLGGAWGRSPRSEPSEYDAARVRDGDDAA